MRPPLSIRVAEYLCLRNAVNWGSVVLGGLFLVRALPQRLGVLATEWSLRAFGIKINAL